MAAPKEKTTIMEASITHLVYNADRTQCAFTPNNHTVVIADCTNADCTKWKVLHTLEEHGQSITGIDWHPKTNRILSSAQDRTAFVWEYDKKADRWEPLMLMLEAAMKRGLTCAAWSCDGDRAYIGSAACNIATGMFSEENNWWWCKAFKDLHASTVTSVAPHPSQNRLVATGSTDCRVSIVDAAIKAVDGQAPGILADFYFKGWVNCVTFSPSGTALAVALHDSSVAVVVDDTMSFHDVEPQRILLPSLPLRTVSFMNDSCIIGAGHDFYPVQFAPKGGKWKLVGKFAGSGKKAKELTETQKARAAFVNAAATGQKEAVELAQSKHKNTIVAICRAADNNGEVDTGKLDAVAFTTASMDGRVEQWMMKEAEAV